MLSGPDGGRRSKIATDLADQMAGEESLWLPMARFDEIKDDVDWLVRIGVLTPNTAGSSVGFTHQTMFDYALARAFAKETGRLSTFVFERQASIFCRPKVWAGLTYLRGASPAGYAEEISILWHAQGLRRHLRFLLIEFLGQQRDPSDVEEALLVSAFDKPDEQALVLRAIAGSPGWFERLKRGIITLAMTSDSPARDWVSPVLNAAVEFAPEGVADLISEHWLPTGGDDYRAWLVLQNATAWSERMIEAGIAILTRAQIAPLYLDQLAGSLGLEQPRAALRLIRAALDRGLHAAIAEGQILAAEPMPKGLEPADEGVWRMRHDATRAIKNMLETSNDWDMLRALAEHAPADTIEILWPWFTAALQSLDDLRPEGRDRPLYALQYEADFRFEGENGLDLPQPSIPSAFRIALDKLAAEAPDAFRIWMTAAGPVEFVPVHRLIAYTMCAHPETYASDAHAYLLGDERRWSLGNLQDYSETSTRLVTAVAPFWDQDQIAVYEDRIRNYRPAVPPDLDNPEGRRAWARIRRSHRLRLLRALPTNQRTRATAELVRSEERAIGDGRVGVTFSGVYSPSSIMSVAEMGRAKDDDIINAFQSLPDATRWDHPKFHRKGGNIQLSREFASFAKDNPDRAMRLIGRFEPDFGERAAGSAISEMASTADPVQLQAIIIDLAKRGFDGDEFQSYIASAFESLLSADAAILPEVISILRGWLLATPPRDVMTGNDDGGKDWVDIGTPTNDDPEGRSLLWGYGGLSVVPSGPFPLLHALARYYLVAGDQDTLRELLAACLPLGFESEIWGHLLALLRYLRPAESKDAQPAIALLTDILRQHPELVGSREVAFLFGHVHWWAPELVEQELPAWATSDRRGVRQGYGELVALLALLHPEREWPKVALGALERGDDSDAKAGAAITAVNV